MLGCDALGVELDAVNGQLAVREPLNDAVVAVGRHLEAVWDAVR